MYVYRCVRSVCLCLDGHVLLCPYMDVCTLESMYRCVRFIGVPRVLVSECAYVCVYLGCLCLNVYVLPGMGVCVRCMSL